MSLQFRNSRGKVDKGHNNGYGLEEINVTKANHYSSLLLAFSLKCLLVLLTKAGTKVLLGLYNLHCSLNHGYRISSVEIITVLTLKAYEKFSRPIRIDQILNSRL